MLHTIAQRHPKIVSMTSDELHTWQVGKHREWADGYNSWRQSQGFSGPGASPEWPVQIVS